jgi:glycosyltransferase involved in cell wall biosynthesis
VPRILLVTPAELTRDPRARRAAQAARALGYGVVGLSGQISGEPPAPLDGVDVVRVGRQGRTNSQWKIGGTSRRLPAPLRELRGLYRLARLVRRTRALRRAGTTIGRTDVVHANDLETLPAAARLASELHSRLVYDAHELYADFDADPPRIATAIQSRVERRLARRADAVVTVSAPIADELRRRIGVDPIVVLNAPERHERDPPDVPAPPPLRVVYQGAFGTGRPLEDLLRAVRAAPSVELTLRVSRTASTLLEATFPPDVRARVHARDPVDPSEVVAALHGHHVGLLFDRPVTRNAELSAPNKLFEYLMAGLAVVAPDLPGLRWVREEGLGVLFEAGSAEALAAALEELAASPEQLDALRTNARRAAVERYNAEAQRDALARAWGAGSASAGDSIAPA